MTQQERIQWLDAQLQANQYPNPVTMKQEFGIGRSQALADVRWLREERGAPIKKSRIRNGWYYTEPFTPLPLVFLTHDEAIAVRLCFLIARAHLSADTTTALERVIARLSRFNPKLSSLPEESAGAPSIAVSPAPIDVWLLRCADALHDRNLLQFEYHSPRKKAPEMRRVRPYHLRYERGEWWLWTHCEDQQAIRTFALARMRQLALASDAGVFTIPPDFDPEQEAGRGFDVMTGGEIVTVVLRFDEYQSRFVRERVLHRTEEKVELPDGLLQVTMQVAWGKDGEALCRRVLEYGKHVEVMEPPQLRERVAEEVATLAKIYGKIPPPTDDSTNTGL